MPNFAAAVIAAPGDDLSEYNAFLGKLAVGHVVTVPLERHETSRRVMRALNTAARSSGMRLSRLPSSEQHIRFKVKPPTKRTVNLSPEARRARAEKARATRAANRAGPARRATAPR